MAAMLLAISETGSPFGIADILANCITTATGIYGRIMNELFDSEVETALPLSGFRGAVRRACYFFVYGIPDRLAVAVGSNEIATVGRLLGPRRVSKFSFEEKKLPESLIRRPLKCSLLGVAVGSEAVEMTKYLLEFHNARPTRDTLKQAISTGNLELIKLVRERLPEEERRVRMDLMEVAAEFHHPEVLVWLLRDAAVFERELLGVFALERKLADSLVVAFENGFRPWWSGTRSAALSWRASAMVELVPAPEGFSAQGGGWTNLSGATSALRELSCEAGFGPTLRIGVQCARSMVEFEWTKAMSEARLGNQWEVTSIIFPLGVTAIGESALNGFGALESVVFPAGCTVFGESALRDCGALRAVCLPGGCKAVGRLAFAGCSSLVSATFPVGCAAINECSFRSCSALQKVRIPQGCTVIGRNAFSQSGLKEVAIPEGCRVDEGAFLGCASLRSVTIGPNCSSIGGWAFQKCEALTTVVIGSGCTSIGEYAFSWCSHLAWVTLPSTVQSIGAFGFCQCTRLATIAIPNGCQVHTGAFSMCKARVRTL
jgi:hypothetical protein